MPARKKRTPLQDAVKGDRRAQLEAIRDYIADQLDAHLCNTCLNSRLRTGDQASLILRLQTVLEELEGLGSAEENVSSLDRIRLRSIGGGRTESGKDIPLSGKSAARGTGTRRSSGFDGRSA